MTSSKLGDKKDPASKGLRKRLSRATHKLFNRKSQMGMPPKVSSKLECNQDGVADATTGKIKGIDNFAVCIQDGEKGIGFFYISLFPMNI